ncbi:unnamed protein product [Cuscuta epithymum]|uniref:Uncharacterized protein n=1 Tax=Cuscuta epithymum TaxID=186058 RepID=A0AAV0F3Z3_9ASTE|nr:unnamed protein product [Cuscuta epithymum]
MFMATQPTSVEAPVSSHMALFIKVSPTDNWRRRKRFKFENARLGEDDECHAIVTNSWSAGSHLYVSDRLSLCGKELLRRASCRQRGFGVEIEACKRRLAWLGDKQDRRSISKFF